MDEPTVGTDPVLRHNLWVHLKELCDSGQSIILTTHYIEEARNANTVAFMRNGKILAEDEPNLLLSIYESNNLEDVFLKLCHSETKELVLKSEEFCYENQINTQMDEKQKIDFNSEQVARANKFSNEQLSKLNEENLEQINNSDERNVYKDIKVDINYHNNNEVQNTVRNSRFYERCTALLHKNYIRITRNRRHLFFELIFPLLLVMVVLVSIGDGPTGINIAVCDEEVINNRSERWGQLFVNHIDRNIFNIIFYDTIDEAIDSVKSGQNTAAIEINERLTKALRLRFLYMTEANEDTIDESQMYVYTDRSDPLIGLQIERHLYISYLNFVHDVSNRANINSALLKIPLIFEEPIYGNTKGLMKEFATPGLYICITFYVITIITTQMVVEERQGGLFERSIVAGITAPEFLLSNILTQIFIICFQIFSLLLSFLVFAQQITQSFVLFLSLLFFQGFCGMTFGLVIGIIFSDTLIAYLVIIFCLLSSIATAGVVWPVLNMPQIIQLISKLMPNTIAVQSMRDILYRQWTIDYTEVYMGFVVSFVWISVFLITALILFRKS